MSNATPPPAGNAPRGALAGAALVAGAAISLVALSHHPSVHGHGGATLLVQMARLRAADATVHAVVIAAAGAQLFGLAVFSLRRGLRYESVVGAAVAYAIATAAIVGAAILDGFVIPAVAARAVAVSTAGLAASPSADVVAPAMISAAATAVQVLTKIALVSMPIAVILWSTSIVRGTPVLRGVAMLGFVSSAALIGFAVFGGSISAHIVGAIGGLAVVWNIAIGALMIRGDL